MQFGKFEEIQEKGYRAAVGQLCAWEGEGRLRSVYEEGAEGRETARRRGRTLRRNSI